MSDLGDSTWAVDYNGNDQAISGTDWTLLVPSQVLWDLNDTFGEPDYDLPNSQFDVQVSGIYGHDSQLRFKDLVNVKTIEVAIFQVVDGVSSYWYTMAMHTVQASETIVQLNNMEQVNFLEGEIYELRVQLTPAVGLVDCSTTIDGNENFSAWSASWLKLNVLG